MPGVHPSPPPPIRKEKKITTTSPPQPPLPSLCLAFALLCTAFNSINAPPPLPQTQILDPSLHIYRALERKRLFNHTYRALYRGVINILTESAPKRRSPCLDDVITPERNSPRLDSDNGVIC